MAILLYGMPCLLCRRPMKRGQRLVMFAPFATNLWDLLWDFSDGAFHAACFNRNPLARQVQERVRAWEEQRRIWPPPCCLCKRTIESDPEYFTFGHLTDDEQDPLYRYNYLQFHLACLQQWEELPRARALIEALQRSGTWGGPHLMQMLKQMGQPSG